MMCACVSLFPANVRLENVTLDLLFLYAHHSCTLYVLLCNYVPLPIFEIL